MSIVLSTSWVRNLGFQRARKALPAKLHQRLIGATWHSAMSRSSTDYIVWDNQTRYQQIAAYLARRAEPVSWLAIDDDSKGWANADRERLVLTAPHSGLADTNAMDELIRKLGDAA